MPPYPEALVVEDARLDARFKNNPLVVSTLRCMIRILNLLPCFDHNLCGFMWSLLLVCTGLYLT